MNQGPAVSSAMSSEWGFSLSEAISREEEGSEHEGAETREGLALCSACASVFKERRAQRLKSQRLDCLQIVHDYNP